MSKYYVNTKKSTIRRIKYAIKNGPEAKFKFKGSIYDYTHWVASKWNQAHPNDRITREDVGLTREIAEKLMNSYFLPKDKSLDVW